MLRAVEIGDGLAGAFAGMMLASLGCAVTKLVSSEASGGDAYDRAYLDRLKDVRSVDSSGDAPFAELLSGADAILDTTGPGGLDALGLTADALAVLNPHLVVVSVSPFGASGPRAHWKATELIVQAAGGLLASSGHSQGSPARLAGDQAAHVSGVFAAIQVLAGVRGVREGKPAARIDISMQEVMATHWAREIGRYVYTGEGLSRPRPDLGLQGFPHTVQASDGFLFMLALRASWEDLALFLGIAEFTTEEWSTPEARVARWSEIEPSFRAALASRGRYEWFDAGAERGYTFAPVDDALSILESPQLAARGYFEAIEFEGETRRIPSLPFTFERLAADAE